MVSVNQVIFSIVLAIIVLFAVVTSNPLPEHHQKIRIHVPVKHHTHLITQTVVKTVHVPVPVKEKHHHVIEEEEEEEDDDHGWAQEYVSQKKKKKYHPFI